MESQEEFKTALGQLLLDLRGNWAYGYTDRMEKAVELCRQIEDDTSDVEECVDAELCDYDFDGRIFKQCNFYGYQSEDGNTEDVRTYLKENLTHPEYCPILTN